MKRPNKPIRRIVNLVLGGNARAGEFEMSPVIQNFIKGNLTLNVVFRECSGPDEDGGFIAECVELPGCVSQGDTFEEAESGIRDAIQSFLSVMLEDCIANAAGKYTRNMVGISRQETFSVAPPQLLAAAGA